MRLFDTHCHLDDDQFDKDRTGVIERAVAAGLENLLAVGTTATSSACCCGLADEYSLVRAAVGIQPNYVAEAGAEDWDHVEALVSRERVIAIGETGLDRHWD